MNFITARFLSHKVGNWLELGRENIFKEISGISTRTKNLTIFKKINNFTLSPALKNDQTDSKNRTKINIRGLA